MVLHYYTITYVSSGKEKQLIRGILGDQSPFHSFLVKKNLVVPD